MGHPSLPQHVPPKHSTPLIQALVPTPLIPQVVECKPHRGRYRQKQHPQDIPPRRIHERALEWLPELGPPLVQLLFDRGFDCLDRVSESFLDSLFEGETLLCGRFRTIAIKGLRGVTQLRDLRVIVHYPFWKAVREAHVIRAFMAVAFFGDLPQFVVDSPVFTFEPIGMAAL